MADKVEKWYQREGWKFDMHWDLKGAIRAALADPECNEALRQLAWWEKRVEPFFSSAVQVSDFVKLSIRAEFAEAHLAAALRDKERLKEYLKEYANHLHWCSQRHGRPNCDCGLDAAMSSSQPPAPKDEQ